MQKLLACAIAAAAVAVVASVDRTAYARSARRSAEPTRTVWDSVYTDSQVARGDSVYKATCVKCHGAELKGTDDGSPLVGDDMFKTWNDRTVGDLHDQIRKSMPPDNPKSLSRSQVSDVVALILSKNSFPSGRKPLPEDLDTLANIKLLQKHP